jgi:hypothetical protein
MPITFEFLAFFGSVAIDAGRHDARVAIGRTLGNRHYVKEVSAGEDSIFAVANDLVEVIRRMSRATSVDQRKA